MLLSTDHLLALDTLAVSGAFQEAVYAARLGHYIGVANINDAGLDLLEALAKLRGETRGEGAVL